MTADVQLLHLVIGGELEDVTSTHFRDLTQVEYVGAFPNYKEAYDAWRARAQATVDNALMRFFILHAHRLIDPTIPRRVWDEKACLYVWTEGGI